MAIFNQDIRATVLNRPNSVPAQWTFALLSLLMLQWILGPLFTNQLWLKTSGPLHAVLCTTHADILLMYLYARQCLWC